MRMYILLSLFCKHALSVVFTQTTSLCSHHSTDFKDPGHLSENYLRVRNTCTDTQHEQKGGRYTCGDVYTAKHTHA